jgi:hypothetical protein|mmetsp:Transcript_19552/g.31701  ORF Transcript_19552/g.31701 Transcript_19552/m.31701 type:complete len:284 (-) Transcript_19552:110-961(-)
MSPPKGSPDVALKRQAGRQPKFASVEVGDQYYFFRRTSYKYNRKCVEDEIVTVKDKDEHLKEKGIVSVQVIWSSGFTYWVHVEDLLIQAPEMIIKKEKVPEIIHKEIKPETVNTNVDHSKLADEDADHSKLADGDVDHSKLADRALPDHETVWEKIAEMGEVELVEMCKSLAADSDSKQTLKSIFDFILEAEAEDEVIVTFEPGAIDIESSDGKTVLKVVQGGQAERAGVKAGWKIKAIGGQPCDSFKDEIFKDARTGNASYEVTFDKATYAPIRNYFEIEWE